MEKIVCDKALLKRGQTIAYLLNSDLLSQKRLKESWKFHTDFFMFCSVKRSYHYFIYLLWEKYLSWMKLKRQHKICRNHRRLAFCQLKCVQPIPLMSCLIHTFIHWEEFNTKCGGGGGWYICASSCGYHLII